MRRIICVLICLITFISPTISFAAESNPFTYEIVDGKAVITSYSGIGADLVIPEKIDNIAVSAIGSHAFEFNSIIKTVTVPDNITSIGESAFRSCRELTDVKIGKNTIKIGTYAFAACPNLVKMTVSTDNTNYSTQNNILMSKDGKTLFQYVGKSADVVIPDKVEQIGDGAFLGENLTTVTFSSTVRVIGNYAFSGCMSLQSVTLPTSVTQLGTGCFLSCVSLESVVILGEVTVIPERTFSMCGKLSHISLPETLTTLSSEAFYNCMSLIDIEIPSNVSIVAENSIGTYLDFRSNSSVAVQNAIIIGGNEAVQDYAKLKGIEYIDVANIFYGDINYDKAVDAADASLALTEYITSLTGQNGILRRHQLLAADINRDNAVDATDASQILEIYANMQTR